MAEYLPLGPVLISRTRNAIVESVNTREVVMREQIKVTMKTEEPTVNIVWTFDSEMYKQDLVLSVEYLGG